MHSVYREKLQSKVHPNCCEEPARKHSGSFRFDEDKEAEYDFQPVNIELEWSKGQARGHPKCQNMELVC